MKKSRITKKGLILLESETVGKVIEEEGLKFAFFKYIGLNSKELRMIADMMEGKE